MIFLAAGLVLIVGLSILERVRERPSFDWSRSFRQMPLFQRPIFRSKVSPDRAMSARRSPCSSDSTTWIRRRPSAR